MRVKLAYSNTRLLLPVNFQDYPTISQLIKYFKERLSQHLGTNDIFIPQLAIDGYLLNGEEKVKDVLKDDDCIVAFDYNKWATLHKSYLNIREPWLKVERDDFVDNQLKWATVGEHKLNRIYIRMGKGRIANRLWVFSIDELNNIHDPFIGSCEDDDGKWFIEAKFQLKDKKVNGISLHVKSSSERQTWADSIEIKIEKGKIIKGKVTHLSGSEEEDDEEVEYTFPKPIKKGEEIKIETPPKPKKYDCESDSQVKINWGGKIECNQSFARNGKFNNFIITNGLTVVNTKPEPIAIVKTTSEYQDKDGNWKKPLRAVVGYQVQGFRGRLDYQWKEGATNFNLDKNQSVTLAVSTVIEVEGTPGSDFNSRARAHKSLPQPLPIRITMEDQHGKKVIQRVEQVNPPVNIPTKESLEKSWKTNIKEFVYCDNVENDQRIYFALYEQNKKNVLRMSYGTYWTWGKKEMKGFAFKAVNDKKEEYPFDFMNRKAGDNEFKAWGLVDLERQKLYGVKIYLKTKTSEVTQYVKLPKPEA